MDMPGKNKKHSYPPLVVSMDCSRFKSLYLSCRRHFSCSKSSSHHLPAKPVSKRSASLSKATSHNKSTSLTFQTTAPSRKCVEDGQAAAQAYWKRARQLKLELIQFNKWLNTEKKHRDGLNNKSDTQSAKLEIERSHKCCGRTEVMRLADGSYLHNFNIKALGRPCRNLAIQVSAPAIIPAETGYNISQVLNRIALMGRDNLVHWLLESMPMSDISGMEINGSPITPSSEEGFLEAIFLSSIEKLENLVMEGLRIQISGKKKVKYKKIREKKDEEIGGECILLMMPIQLRELNKGYQTVREMMIGLVEASIADTEETGFLIHGVHVTGLSGKRRDGDGRGDCLWCISEEL